MRRIFMGMAVWALILLIVSVAMGSLVPPEAGKPLRWHMVVGLFTAFYVILLHSIVFVHLLGTGLGVKRALFEHRLPQDDIIRRLWTCKMAAYPPAFAVMVLTIMTAVGGGAVQAKALDSVWHALLAMSLIVANVLVFPIELKQIDANAEVMAEVEAQIAASAQPATATETAATTPSSPPASRAAVTTTETTTEGSST